MKLYVAVLMFGGLIDEVKVLPDYLQAFFYLKEKVTQYYPYIDMSKLTFDFDELQGTKYEGSNIYEDDFES